MIVSRGTLRENVCGIFFRMSFCGMFSSEILSSLSNFGEAELFTVRPISGIDRWGQIGWILFVFMRRRS